MAMSTAEKLLGGVQLGISKINDQVDTNDESVRIILSDICDVSKDIISRKSFASNQMIFDMDTCKVLRWISVKRSVSNTVIISARDAKTGTPVEIRNLSKDEVRRRILGLKPNFKL